MSATTFLCFACVMHKVCIGLCLAGPTEWMRYFVRARLAA